MPTGRAGLSQPREVTQRRHMSPIGRYCCKSPKLPGDNFPAIRRFNQRPPICVVSIKLRSSPVSFSSCDKVPHIFTRKSRLQPGEFSITSAKRLLQHGVIPGSCHTKAHGISSPETYEATHSSGLEAMESNNGMLRGTGRVV